MHYCGMTVHKTTRGVNWGFLAWSSELCGEFLKKIIYIFRFFFAENTIFTHFISKNHWILNLILFLLFLFQSIDVEYMFGFHMMYLYLHVHRVVSVVTDKMRKCGCSLCGHCKYIISLLLQNVPWYKVRMHEQNCQFLKVYFIRCWYWYKNKWIKVVWHYISFRRSVFSFNALQPHGLVAVFRHIWSVLYAHEAV